MAIATATITPTACLADDWPQWMGPHRDGTWRETGILPRFDTNGPPRRWQVPIGAGYVGPAVHQGRVFLLDRKATPPTPRREGDPPASPRVPGHERVLCLDAATGKTLWEHTYNCPYGIAYPSGPRATPVVGENRLYTLGAMGDVKAFDAIEGRVLWSVSLPTAYACEPPVWGYAAHPLLDGPRLIVPAGGPGSALVALDTATGKELWRALDAREIGYAPPILGTIAGRRQLIFWHPDAVTGLNPETGAVLWSHPYPVGGKPQRPEVTIALPRYQDDRLFLTSFYQGSLLLRVPGPGESPTVLWNRRSARLSNLDQGLHSVMSTPWFGENWIYGVCGGGELRCLDARNGDRQWETLELFHGKGQFLAHAFIIQQADRFWFWTDQGELAVGRLSPHGLNLICRSKILETTESTRGRDVLWCHPAFADRKAFLHNGRELVCLDLAAAPARPG